jgi:hypothetical protein
VVAVASGSLPAWVRSSGSTWASHASKVREKKTPTPVEWGLRKSPTQKKIEIRLNREQHATIIDETIVNKSNMPDN